MRRHLLALNVGSATLKGATYGLEATQTGRPPRLTEQSRAEIQGGGEPQERLARLLAALSEPAQDPDIVVHRIVHGGGRKDGHELDDALLTELAALAPLAPLHQPAALAFVRAARIRWPLARYGVAFDTSFHAALAPWSRRLPIPAKWDGMGVRRYGFHGLAFASALRAVAGRDASIRQGRAVFAHLGGGCSVCAVADGISLDTTMALTPLGGVPGPTRSGDLDPGAVLYLLRQGGLDAEAVEDGLSHQGGLAGVAGHGDVRVLLGDQGPSAQLAVEQFTVRIAQSIAAMATGIGGLDHLVFSGGIGHRAPALRERIVARLAWLGLTLDPVHNSAGEMRIDRSVGVRIWNVAVDEERELVESALSWL
jgi:acetate kinase